jgi:hypothetical protein
MMLSGADFLLCLSCLSNFSVSVAVCELFLFLFSFSSGVVLAVKNCVA